MTVTAEELEAAIRAAIQTTHVEVQDKSGGCGEKYSVLIVSKVLFFQLDNISYLIDQMTDHLGIRRKDDTGTA